MRTTRRAAISGRFLPWVTQRSDWPSLPILMAAILLAALLVPGAAGAEPADDVPPGTITTVAGGLGDGKPAAQTAIGDPFGMTFDAAGNLYVADSHYYHRVRKISPAGVVTTVAGTGFKSLSRWWLTGDEDLGDGGPATQAVFQWPGDVVVGPDGSLYIGDLGNARVRRVDATTGIITTVAGRGNYALDSGPFVDPGSCPRNPGGPAEGDGGPATEACLLGAALVFDAAGNLYVAERYGYRVRRIDAATGIITTVVGTGERGVGSCGDGGPARDACMAGPADLAMDAVGNLLIADGHRIRRVDSRTGVITTVAGGGARLPDGSCGGDVGDDGPATDACLDSPEQIALDEMGNLFIADSRNRRVRKVDAATGIITTVAGSGGPPPGWGSPDYKSGAGDGGPATQAPLGNPIGVAVDSSGRIYIADTIEKRIRRVESDGRISTFAGTGYPSFSGDGGPATMADVDGVAGMAVDREGDLYVAENSNHRVRRISPEGVITTVAGSHAGGWYSGDGGPATEARLAGPHDVAVNARGDVFIADTDNCRVRKVDAQTGVISTVAGLGAGYQNSQIRAGVVSVHNAGCGYSGDGGPAVQAQLYRPMGVAVDAAGNLFIADWGNCRIRKVDAVTGIITTVAGRGIFLRCAAYSGDGGPAILAQLSEPSDVEVDAAGNLYIADSGFDGTGPHNWRVRRVDAETEIITTVAGNGQLYCPEPVTQLRCDGLPRGNGDGGPATKASLNTPIKLAVDAAGNLFIAERGERGGGSVRRVDAQTGIITTVAGSGGFGSTGDGGPARRATFSTGPQGVAINQAGDLFVSDSGHSWHWYFPHGGSRVRKITGVADGPGPTPTPTVTPDPSPTEGGNRGSYPVTPDDPFFGEDSGDPLALEPTQWALRKVQAPQAWQQLRATGFGIRVAVLDSGVDLQHEDLQCAGKLDVGPGSDVVANDSNPDDENSHGTHVAGIIGACTNNGKGVAGVAPDATLVPVRVLDASGSGTDAQLIAGLDKAVELGVHVINMSLGYIPGKQIINNVSAIDAAIGRARDAGIVVVAAAGNDSFPLCEYPALAEDVICVGATDPRDVKAAYSVFPNKTDAEDTIGPGMVAPGGSGEPVFCDTYDENILSTIPLEFDDNGCTDVQGYANHFGTSMAAPHVSGVAALVYDRLGGERNEDAAAEVIAALIDNADDLGAPGYDPVFGWGRVNALGSVLAVTPAPEPTSTPTSTESGSPTPSPSESTQPDVTDVSFTETSAHSGQHSDETLFEARLTDSNGDPINGVGLSFELVGDGSRTFNATTDDDGVAAVTPTLEERPGPYQLTVRYDGNENHAGDADTMSFVVDKEDSALDLTETKGKDKALVAHLSDGDTSADGIAGRTIDFYAGAELIGSATTGNDGVATFKPPQQKGKKQAYEARFGGDDFYVGSSAQEKGNGGNGGGNGGGGNGGGGNGGRDASTGYGGKVLLM